LKVIILSALALSAIFSVPAYAKDHSAKYQVGVLISTESVRDINIFGSALANASTAFGHNVHTLQVPDGVYAIESPVSTGGSILMAIATNNQAPVSIHTAWFMDDLHPGDKVLFYAECDKREDCTYYLPKPDQPGKEFHTHGHFYPTIAKTNTTQLCGTGKLSAAVEAQVCTSPEPAPRTPGASPPASTSSTASSDPNSAAAFADLTAGKQVMANAGMKLLVGRKVVVQRTPFYVPGTYQTIPLSYAGQTATIVEVKPASLYGGMDKLIAKYMANMPPESRDAVNNMRDAAIIVIQFADGTKADTGATPVIPSMLSSCLELVQEPGVTSFVIPAIEASAIHKVRGSIGIRFHRVSGFKNGVLVESVMPSGPAEKAGIKSGDIILSVEGGQIKDGDDLVRVIANCVPGSTIRLGYLSEGKVEDATVTIADHDTLYAGLGGNPTEAQ